MMRLSLHTSPKQKNKEVMEQNSKTSEGDFIVSLKE